MDLDQSGNGWQVARVYLGPSLGWVNVQIKPTRLVTAAGTSSILPGDSIILVNATGAVALNLPDVRLWVQEPAYQPATAFERVLYIKDLGGNAAANPITITPFGTQTIDLLAQNFTIVQNRQVIRLYPLNDLSGWWVG
jgi:hypothetical protein